MTTPQRWYSFGEAVRALRRERGMGLVDLAHRAGIDPALLSRIENKKRGVPRDFTFTDRIAAALDIAEDSPERQELGRRFIEDLLFGTGVEKLDVAAMDATAAAVAAAQPTPAQRRPVLCRTLAELGGRAMEHMIQSQAVAVVVHGADGAVQEFRMRRTGVAAPLSDVDVVRAIAADDPRQVLSHKEEPTPENKE